MKALVIGCGEMGRTAIEDLQKYGDLDELTVATRTIEKAYQIFSGLQKSKTKLSAVPLDLEKDGDLSRLMKNADVALNCAGPNYKYEVPVAKAAIEAKTNLVDINDDHETTHQMLALDEQAKKAGIVIILGMGASPGVNNILVRSAANQLDDVEEIHTAWVMSASDPGGLALSRHLLYSLSSKAFTVENGEMKEVRSFTDGKERLEFPHPVGEINVFHIGHPEPITLARAFPNAKYIDDKASFHPPVVNDWILYLGKLVRDFEGHVQVRDAMIDPMDFAAAYFRQKCLNMKNIPKEGALRVMVKGKKRGKSRTVFYSAAGRIAQGTGIPASIGAIMLLKGKIKTKGVAPPEMCVDPHDFLYEILDRRNVTKLNGWIEE